MNIVDINKDSSKLKVGCFKMPNASYTHRCVAFETENETVITKRNYYGKI